MNNELLLYWKQRRQEILESFMRLYPNKSSDSAPYNNHLRYSNRIPVYITYKIYDAYCSMFKAIENRIVELGGNKIKGIDIAFIYE